MVISNQNFSSEWLWRPVVRVALNIVVIVIICGCGCHGRAGVHLDTPTGRRAGKAARWSRRQRLLVHTAYVYLMRCFSSSSPAQPTRER